MPTKLEGGVLVLEVVLLMAFAAPIWANRVDDFPVGSDVVHLRAIGEQFRWNFQYADANGNFAKREAMLVSSSNSLGIDNSDPVSKNNLVTANELHLPVNTPCIIDVMSKDVIHDFCIPNMREAQDAIPGSIIPMWFKPIQTGTYDVVCAQLCGSSHALMKATLVVDSPADYKKWCDEVKSLRAASAEPAPTGASSLAASR